MNTFLEMISGVQDDLTVGSGSSLFNPDIIKRTLNRSRNKAYAMFRWPDLEDAMKTWSVVDQEYYDFPETWQSDSLWKLRVDSVDYGDPLAFKDYLSEKENDLPSGLKKMWSVFGRQIFIYPTPTVTKDVNTDPANICVWGQKAGDDLVNDGDTTIFSYSQPDCNEAIVLEAISMLKNKGDVIQPVMRSYIGGTQLLSYVAQNILTLNFAKIRQNQAKYEKTTGMFNDVDFFKN